MRNCYCFIWKTFHCAIHTVLEAAPFFSVTNNLQDNCRAIFGNIFHLQTLFYVTYEAQEGAYPCPKQKEVDFSPQTAVCNVLIHYTCRARLDLVWAAHYKGSYLVLSLLNLWRYNRKKLS